MRIEGSIENFRQRLPAAMPEELKGVYSRIVLAVIAQNTADALAGLLPHLAADGFILSIVSPKKPGKSLDRTGPKKKRLIC